MKIVLNGWKKFKKKLKRLTTAEKWWKWLKSAEDNIKWMKISRNSWNLMKTIENSWNSWNGWKELKPDENSLKWLKSLKIIFLGFFRIWNQSTVGASAGEGLRLLALVTCYMWHVTCDCDMWHVICDIWHGAFECDKWFFLNKKCKKNANTWLKSANKCRKVSQRWDFIVLVQLSAHAKSRITFMKWEWFWNYCESAAWWPFTKSYIRLY